MDLTHSFTVPTSVDDAWALFMDLEKVGGCFPGATVTEVSDDGFAGTVKVKLGPIALLYTGTGSFVERDDAAHRAVIEAKGKDKRGNGTAGATVTIELSPDGTGTRADVVTDLAVTGKPAQFGRGVMQDVSDKLLMAFIACIESRLGEGAGWGEGADAAAAGESGGAGDADGGSHGRDGVQRGRRRGGGCSHDGRHGGRARGRVDLASGHGPGHGGTAGGSVGPPGGIPPGSPAGDLGGRGGRRARPRVGRHAGAHEALRRLCRRGARRARHRRAARAGAAATERSARDRPGREA